MQDTENQRKTKERYDEAVEFFMYNVQGAYVGNQTPIYLTKL